MTTLIYHSPGCGVMTSIKNACDSVGVETVVARLGNESFASSIAFARQKLDEKAKVLLVIDVEMPITANLMVALFQSVQDTHFSGNDLTGLSGVSIVVPKAEADNVPMAIKTRCLNIDAKEHLQNPSATGKSHIFSDTAIPNTQLGFMVLSDIGELDNFIKTRMEKNKPEPSDLIGYPEPK